MTLRKVFWKWKYFLRDIYKAVKGFYIYKIYACLNKKQSIMEDKFEQLLIVYGTLKSGYGNNRLLDNEHSELVASNVETEPIYTLYDGGFPVVERGGTTSIKGELWRVKDKDVLNKIHSLEGCTGIPNHPKNWYDIDVQETPYGKAYIYVQNKGKSGRTQIVESGKWK